MKRYRVDLNKKLQRPLMILSFYKDKPIKTIANEAVSSFLEGSFIDMLGELKDNPNSYGENIGEISEESIQTLKEWTRTLRTLADQNNVDDKK